MKSQTHDLLTGKDNCLVADRRLWCGQMEARCSLYHIGVDTFEVYTSYAGSVPVRFVGSLGNCVLNGELFINARKAEGYEEQLPSYASLQIN